MPDRSTSLCLPIALTPSVEAFFLPSQVTSKYNQPSMDLDNKVAGLTVAIGAALG
ncbi:hypothetical protein [Lactobacillus equicursoris]|uniref:hypothetical protein n=1 Tax=Lactobacillus equicursoris TaxID=420645 RepID=UPI0002EFF233|nr:hypothetical protein [Lactobacillus equicursoris]